MKILEMLKGKKTYIASSIGLILAGLLQFDILTGEQYMTIMALLAPVFPITLRAALKK